VAQIVDQGIIAAMSQIVVVLDTYDFANSLPLCNLRRRDMAQPDMPNWPCRCRSAKTASGASSEPSAG
jgi:hypothetical protein